MTPPVFRRLLALLVGILPLGAGVHFTRAANAASPPGEAPLIAERTLAIHAVHRGTWESRFHDERYWTRYFDLLARSRFNRITLVLGDDSGTFLALPFPYFSPTPQFASVTLSAVTVAQQEKNLTALQRLVALAHARGLAVNVSVSAAAPPPESVRGLAPERRDAYLRAAVPHFLARVGSIDGLQIRLTDDAPAKVWQEIFSGLHSRYPNLTLEVRGGVAAADFATAARVRQVASVAHEQMGLPFRPTSAASDLRPEGETVWRVGNARTTRVLLWGDPDYVRRFSTAAVSAGASGWEVDEPLALKMAGQPDEAAPFALMPGRHRSYDYEFERYWAFFLAWGHGGYAPQSAAEAWSREFERRFGAAAPHVEAALRRASQVLPMIVSAASPTRPRDIPHAWPERQGFPVSLSDYATNQPADPEQFESFVEAAKRILTPGATTAKRTPEMTSRWFDATADTIFAAVHAAEAKRVSLTAAQQREFDATLTDLKILAHLSRFHARRIVAAVHYQLFKRGLRLAELLAATYQTREVVAAWRDLVAAAGDRYTFDLAFGDREHALSGHWRDELRSLETDLKELEEQCCPPDEKIAKEKVWAPLVAGDGRAPRVSPAGDRLAHARAGEPLRLSFRVEDVDGVASVRLRHRSLGQSGGFATLDLRMTSDEPGLFSATLPAGALTPGHDLVYFVEAIDRAGNGAIWPDLAIETPYVRLAVGR